jgi:hypothetical protein
LEGWKISNLPILQSSVLPIFREDNNENLANLYFTNLISFNRLRRAEQRQPNPDHCPAGSLGRDAGHPNGSSGYTACANFNPGCQSYLQLNYCGGYSNHTAGASGHSQPDWGGCN